MLAGVLLLLSGCSGGLLGNAGVPENNTMAVVSFTVQVLDSGGNGISGVQVRYGAGGNYTSAWLVGTTGADGKITGNLPSGKYSFQAVWRNGNQIRNGDGSGIDISGGGNVATFQTVQVVLRLEACDTSASLNGGTPRFGAGSSFWTSNFPGGATGSGSNPLGESIGELFPGIYSFEMGFKATALAKLNVTIPTIPAAEKIVWKATKVTLQNAGSIAYGGAGDSTWFTKPWMYLLAGTCKFHFYGAGYFDLVISNCSTTYSAYLLKLLDHTGTGLTGGTARVKNGSWAYVPGATNASGELGGVLKGLLTNVTFEMRYNNTVQQIVQDISVNQTVIFKTVLVTLRLQEADTNISINGGKPRFGLGGTYTTWWFPTNPGTVTGATAAGETAAELLPGTCSFEMQYKGTAEAKTGVDITGATMTVLWEATKVMITYAGGPISYGGPLGDSAWYTNPMYLLPGTYNVHFRGGDMHPLTWSGDTWNWAE